MERLVAETKGSNKPKEKRPGRPVNPERRAWTRAFESRLGRRVGIRTHDDSGGVASIPFKDAKEIEALIAAFARPE